MNNMVSIVIPSRNEQFLVKTVEDLLEKATGEIEIIPILDGYWPNPPLPDDPRIKAIHRDEPRGMRNGITSAVELAEGKYIMKIDAHCMVDKGFDEKLVADCEKDWVVIPRRKRLDAENWCIQDVGKPDVDYNYLSFPDNPADFGGPGLNGRIWTNKARERTGPEYNIDEELSFQGSCWFMHKEYFKYLELMDEENFGPFWNEAQEIGFKAWLSGGKVMRNKKTWYAHLHKGKKYGRGYPMNNSWATKGATYTKRFLYEDKVWHKQKYPLTWLLKRFMPMPGWGENWEEQIQALKSNSTEDTNNVSSNISVNISNLELIKKKYNITSDEKFIKLPGTRSDFVKLLKELNLNKGIELGVEQGEFTEELCKLIPKIKLTAIDAWKSYKGYRDHVNQDKLNGFYEKVKKRLAPYNCDIMKAFSMDAVKHFEDGSLDFVYIDANHEFVQTTLDISMWEKKVRKGGIVAGHDYRRGDKKWVCHVKDVVQAWTYSHGIRPYFIFKDEKSPSWFWVKE